MPLKLAVEMLNFGPKALEVDCIIDAHHWLSSEALRK